MRKQRQALPAAAAGLLEADAMTPLSAAQLLANVPLAGDRPSAAAVRAVLQALPEARAIAR